MEYEIKDWYIMRGDKNMWYISACLCVKNTVYTKQVDIEYKPDRTNTIEQTYKNIETVLLKNK